MNRPGSTGLRITLAALLAAWGACGSPSAGDGPGSGDGGGGGPSLDAGAPDAGEPVCAEGDVTGPGTTGGDAPRIVVSADIVKFDLSPVLMGTNVNKWYRNAQGLWKPRADAPDPDAVAKAARAGVGLLRFPGGTSSNLFDWKRAIGPEAMRGCQTEASDLTGRTDNSYGPDEYMQLVHAVGAEAQIMVPFANGSPASAADWVEYMDAPVGENPGGGVAWAEVRAANGSPEPYNVTRWEIGNEQDRGGGQAYWMATSNDPKPSAADRRRLSQYIDGDEIRFVDQPAGRDCDFTRTTTTSAPNQTFYIRWGLIKAGTWPSVTVGGQAWSRVDDLSSAGPGARVFQVDRQRASITFGDGTHGAIPPAGQVVRVTYTFHHDGFVAMYDAMKRRAAQIGIDIDVCAAWDPPARRGSSDSEVGQPSFPAAMAGRGLADRYDCVAAHPYTNFHRDFDDVWKGPRDAYADHMLGDGWSEHMIRRLADDVNARSTAGADGRAAFVTVSELGALWFGQSDAGTQSVQNVPAYSATMMHALFMASQWIHFARWHLGWVEGNTLAAEPGALRGTLGGSATGFVYSAEASVREAMSPAFAGGSRWTASKIENQVEVSEGARGSWPVFVVAASTGADGALRIVVVNRGLADRDAVVDPQGYERGATVEVTTVWADSIGSYVDRDTDPASSPIHLDRTTETADTRAFPHTFPAASVTVLTLRPPC